MGLSRERLLAADLAKRHWLLRYGFALLFFGLIIGISLLNTRYFELRLNLTIPVVLALVAVAWYAGRGPGIFLGILFQATTIYYATIPPDSTLGRRLFAYFSTFALYIFLALVISGLRRTQDKLKDQRDLLEVTLTSIGDGVIATDTSGRITFMNPVAEKMTGWHRHEARGHPLEEVFRIVNEVTREPVDPPTVEALVTGRVQELTNHTVLLPKGGGEIPIDDSAAPIKEGNRIRGVILVFANVTERKAAERSRRESEMMHRLVEAQEAERRRIARDLHDHLGQKMTALRLKIEDLKKHSDSNGLEAAVIDVSDTASEVDRDIGFLSWELRPTELEELGLVDALSSFVREWSRQYGIEAEFEAGAAGEALDLNRLSQDVETNLYRITQEALNNVLKHAEASHVSVLLQILDGRLVLIIEDNGTGMTPAQPADNGNAGRRGLGLIGMRERTALMNGKLEIDSDPDSGTTLIFSIPLEATESQPA